MRKYSDIYKELLEYVYKDGESCSPRGQLIKEWLVGVLDYDPQQMIADFEGKEFNFKYLYGEMLWYLSGSLDSGFIGKYAKLWTRITNNRGKLNSNYGHLVFYKTNEHGTTQYEWALNSLRQDKDTRQAILHYNQPVHQEDGVKDFPCTLYQQFFIRNNKLMGITNMRSNDLFFGTNYDVIWFGLVMQSLYLDLVEIYPDLELGTMTHLANSLHIYEKDFEKTEQIIKSEQDNNYNIKLTKSMLKIIAENQGNDILTIHNEGLGNKEEFINELYKLGIEITQI